MNIQLLLADVVRVADGKLDALGIGWNVTRAGSPHAIGALIEIPWAEHNIDHHLVITLCDAEGQPALDANGNPCLRIEGDIRADQPPGVLLGEDVTVPAPFPIPAGLPMVPGRRYKYVASIDGITMPEWEKWFSVAPDALRKAS